MKLYVYIGIVFLLILVLWWIYRKKNYYPYKARHLLTKREYRFYLLLREVADEYHCIICPKVGVKDLLSVTDKKQYMKYFHKIAQKHVDFVICDRDLYVLFAIELDDSTHETRDARKRDHLKDKAFAAAGIPLKRITEIDKKQIRKLFH
ncbi:hypothetical protein JCM17039_00860 [Blautia glucerasea]